MTQQYVIRVIGLVNGMQTSHDGRLLRRYEPFGVFMPGCQFIETCAAVRDALRFDSVDAAMQTIMRSVGVRQDGKPNRPIRAFTLEVVPVVDGVLMRQSVSCNVG